MSRSSARLSASVDQLRELLLDQLSDMDADTVDGLPGMIRDLQSINDARRPFVSAGQFWLSDIVFNLAAFGLGCMSETINERVEE